MSAPIQYSGNFEKLIDNVRDANYSEWENPFAPEYEIVSVHIVEMGLMIDPKDLKHHKVISRSDYWDPN